MRIFEKLAICAMIICYFIAGIKHFTNPAPYLTIIPAYIPYPETMSYLAGFFEILFALILINAKTRKYASYGIILMLIVLLPCHIYMIQKANEAPFILGKWTITPIIAWIRIPLQFILILWAFWCSKMKFKLV